MQNALLHTNDNSLYVSSNAGLDWHEVVPVHKAVNQLFFPADSSYVRTVSAAHGCARSVGERPSQLTPPSIFLAPAISPLAASATAWPATPRLP